ncbi:MAG: DNA translocase FtsK 4TM domain-containing protein [Alphaproteobacteria bacterium]|nr:DNA translocase FtsK 4TM domain-containing protein [Alphaproteobacteria bacterium]
MIHQAIRRLAELSGLGLWVGGGVVGFALASFTRGDPSLNFATGGTVHNVTGPTGAALADLLYRGAGWAALFPVVVALAWGWRLVKDHGLPAWRLRLIGLPLAWLLLAMMLAGTHLGGPYGLAEGPGGAAGQLGLRHVTTLVAGVGYDGGLIWTATTVLALVLAVAVLALDVAELGLAMHLVRRSAAMAWRLATTGTTTGLRHLLGRSEPDAAAKPDRPGAFGRLWPKLPSLPSLPRLRRSPPEPEAAPAFLRHPGTPWAAPTAATPKPPPRAAEPPGEAAESEAAAATVINVQRTQSAKPSRRFDQGQQTDLPLSDLPALPPISLLQEPDSRSGPAVDAETLTENARLLENVLEDFGVRGEIMTVRPGPVVTLYELQPAPGTKASRVIGLADDIARNMEAVSVRIATIRGKNAIGIELPNAKREMVLMRELLASQAYDKAQNGLPLVLGKDIGGQPVVVNLERMPHLLIAGTTGSGKSVAINVMILSLLYALPPERCRFIMVDPKMLELSVYDDIPHLLTPVVTDPRKAVVALKWAVREMENRYRAMSTLGVRNIRGYNERIEEAIRKGEPMTRRVQTGFDPNTGEPVIEEQALDMRPLPYIVVIVDEMADLMLVAGKEIEAAIQRLAQMARAAGIHLIMATQRPSVDVITGTIKANFPTRISFQVTSKVDSRTILGEGGAEQLLGQGDMLYMAGGGRIQRVHGPFVSDEEVQEITEYLRNTAEPDYVDSVTEDDDVAAGIPGFEGESSDDLYDQAVGIVLRERKASTSFLQRHLKIGYNRAASLIDRMEAERLISAANHVGKREVLVKSNTGEQDL